MWGGFQPPMESLQKEKAFILTPQKLINFILPNWTRLTKFITKNWLKKNHLQDPSQLFMTLQHIR